MPNWSGRLFFFGMVAYLVYVIMIGDGPSWYTLFTKRVKSTGPVVGVAPVVR